MTEDNKLENFVSVALAGATTAELADELVKREGVKTIGVCADKPVIVTTDDDTYVYGNANIIVVQGVE